MATIVLSWKEFNLDLNAVETWLRANAGEAYTGSSGVGEGSTTHAPGLHLNFSEDPSQEVKDAINAYWDSLEADSDEAAAYKSQEDRSADEAVVKAAARAKLLALGFNEDEAEALG